MRKAGWVFALFALSAGAPFARAADQDFNGRALRNGTLPEVWIPPSGFALVENQRHGGFGPPRAALGGDAKP